MNKKKHEQVLDELFWKLPALFRKFPAQSQEFPAHFREILANISNHKSKNLESWNICMQLLQVRVKTAIFPPFVNSPSSVLYLRSSVSSKYSKD